ncbi:MAG: hypothetical protein CMK59_13635, partial [Proteobacteria bacterium]|nr:hypothetical protein [Pseudomonadota bacterium]
KSNLFDIQLQEELAEKLAGQIPAIQSLAQQEIGEKATYFASNSADAASIVKQELNAITQPLGRLMSSLMGANEEFIASIESDQLKFKMDGELTSTQKSQQGYSSQRSFLQNQVGAQALLQSAGVKAEITGFSGAEMSNQFSNAPKDVSSAAIQSFDASAHSGSASDHSGLLSDSSNKELLVAQNEGKLQGAKGEGNQNLTKVSRQIFSRMVDIIERLMEQYKPPFDPAALRQLDVRVNDPAGLIVMEIVQESNQIFVKATAPEGALGDLMQVRSEIENSLNNQGLELGSWDLNKADEKEEKSSGSKKNGAESQSNGEDLESVHEQVLNSIQEESHLISKEL